MKPVFFTKMEGTGNDFVVIDNREEQFTGVVNNEKMKETIVKILDRHYGIGGDGLILIEEFKGYYFNMRYFNRDGSEAELCLNGARCAVKFAHRLGIIEEKGKFLTPSGPVGFAYFPDKISIEVSPPVDIRVNFSITISRKKYKVSYLKLGVPHTVLFVDSYDDINISELGKLIREHKEFQPAGTNVNFVKADKNGISVRTYERGIEDETLSCGSGVVASAYIAVKLFLAESPVKVMTRGGELTVTLKDKLYLEGPANFIYDGTYYI
uniref:Diaminopimelate epimerase n=1 Tax=candidate division WOR-3 bacterium TaxID=2052148 RepID=A0A7C4XLA6_UNCW3